MLLVFEKQKNSQSLLHPTQELADFLVLATQKPHFISELEHHPESRPCTKALSILNVSKAGSKE